MTTRRLPTAADVQPRAPNAAGVLPHLPVVGCGAEAPHPTGELVHQVDARDRGVGVHHAQSRLALGVEELAGATGDRNA